MISILDIAIASGNTTFHRLNQGDDLIGFRPGMDGHGEVDTFGTKGGENALRFVDADMPSRGLSSGGNPKTVSTGPS